MESLPLYTLCLFSMPLNNDIAGIGKPDGICSLTFVVNEFWGFFLYQSVFSIKHSRSAQTVYGALWRFLKFIKF